MRIILSPLLTTIGFQCHNGKHEVTAADWDNFHKISCDALSGIVYLDDKQIKARRGHGGLRQAEAEN